MKRTYPYFSENNKKKSTTTSPYYQNSISTSANASRLAPPPPPYPPPPTPPPPPLPPTSTAGRSSASPSNASRPALSSSDASFYQFGNTGAYPAGFSQNSMPTTLAQQQQAVQQFYASVALAYSAMPANQSLMYSTATLLQNMSGQQQSGDVQFMGPPPPLLNQQTWSQQAGGGGGAGGMMMYNPTHPPPQSQKKTIGESSPYKPRAGGSTWNSLLNTNQNNRHRVRSGNRHTSGNHHNNHSNELANNKKNAHAFLQSTTQSQNAATGLTSTEIKDAAKTNVTVNKKAKRKPMSAHYTSKEWNPQDAIRALTLEKEVHSVHRAPMLILKFPDPELNKEIIQEYSPLIEHVHFQQPSTPRYCFVQLKAGADLIKVQEELNQIPFGTGKVVAELKNMNSITSSEVEPDDIDPYTIYVGNLPTNVSVNRVKSHFPTATRIDIGFAQRMKYTRYAFIRYDNVEDSITAYKRAHELDLGPRSLVIRFRRKRGNIGLNTGPNTGTSNNTRPARTADDKVHDMPSGTTDELSLDSPDTMKTNRMTNVSSRAGTQDKTTTTPVSRVLEWNGVQIKKEPVADTNTTAPLEVIQNSVNVAIKQECDGDYDDISDDDRSSEPDISEMPEDEYYYEDDDFLRRNNVINDNGFGANYWEQTVASRDIKQEQTPEIKKELEPKIDNNQPDTSTTNSKPAKPARAEGNLDALFDGLNYSDDDQF